MLNFQTFIVAIAPLIALTFSHFLGNIVIGKQLLYFTSHITNDDNLNTSTL